MVELRSASVMTQTLPPCGRLNDEKMRVPVSSARVFAVASSVFADFEITTLADGTEVATSPLATEV